MVGLSHEAPNTKATLKFLYSYGGKIFPRYPDGKLRYHGGHTRVLAVPRSIPFSELMVKLGELCGSPVRHLRCQLPTEDLDVLVSITSDEDLANLIDEYYRVSSPPCPSVKIRAFISSSPSSMSKSSSSSSSLSSSSSSSFRSSTGGGGSSPTYAVAPPVVDRCIRQISPPMAYPISIERSASAGCGRKIALPYHAYRARCEGNPGLIYFIHKANHWQ